MLRLMLLLLSIDMDRIAYFTTYPILNKACPSNAALASATTTP